MDADDRPQRLQPHRMTTPDAETDTESETQA